MKDKANHRRNIGTVLMMLALFVLPQARAQAQTSNAAKLGDLSQYRTIAAAVSTMIGKTDFAGPKTRIKDLETLWDRNETRLKPKSPSDWHSLDRAIDNALYEVRKGKPSQVACQDALTALLKLIDNLS